MPNEAHFCVAGYVATKPYFSETKNGLSTLSMRVGWTPRRIDRVTGEWTDGPTCFVSVKCFGRMAQNGKASLDKGDPVVVTGTLRMHDYLSKEGIPRTSVDITATALGHDLSRGITNYIRVRPKSDRADENETPDRQDEEPGAEPAEDHGPAEPSADQDDRELDTAGLDGEDADAEAARLLEGAADPAAAPF